YKLGSAYEYVGKKGNWVAEIAEEMIEF
ncbi:hypothetical protein LCGC14_2645700, partial [marine sediment metagenome]